MVNFKLGTILANLAEVSKQKDTDPERVMDYTRAARTIRDYPGEIEMAYSDGTLKKLPGISSDVYAILDEYFRTGRINEYDELKELYSEELIMFIRISGLGKRRIFKIYDILGIKDLENLRESIIDKSIYKKVLEEPSLEKGFITRAHLDRLAASLDYFESTANLYPKGYIDFFIERLKESIFQLKNVNGLFVTGSVRRKKSFVGDLDIIVLPDFNSKGYDSVRTEEFLKSVTDLGFINSMKAFDARINNMSARFDTIHGVDLEVIVSSDSNFALDLFYTTGCRGHIGAVEKIAKSRGFFNGNRIFLETIKDRFFVEDLDEHCLEGIERPIYEALGLQFVPPELREATGEVELALKHDLPELIEQEDIKGDLHIHSLWSDGIMEIEDLIIKSKKLGYEYIGITDHSSSNVYGNGLDATRMLKKVDFLKTYRSKIKDLYLLIGGEVDIRSIGKLADSQLPGF